MRFAAKTTFERTRMRDAVIPISVLLGFALLSAAVFFKETEIGACVRMVGETVPLTGPPEKIAQAKLDACMGSR